MCEPIDREEKRHVIAQRTAELEAFQRAVASRKTTSRLQQGDQVISDAELSRMVVERDPAGGSYS